MKTPWTLLAVLLAVPSAGAQDPCAETREIRIYLIDRERPDRSWDDTGAALTLTQLDGRAETYLVPRVAKSPPFAASSSPGILRGTVGSPYFLELVTTDPSGDATECPPSDEPDGVPQEPPTQSPDPVQSRLDLLRQVHQGVCFIRNVPASALAGRWTATITIRLSAQTFTSEEFQPVDTTAEDPAKPVAAVEEVLGKLRHQSSDGASFMALRPSVVELFRELAKLGPAAFFDGTGAIEKDRQWCLATARAIEQSCYRADHARIQELSLQCGPRLQEMKQTVTRSAAKPVEELPAK